MNKILEFVQRFRSEITIGIVLLFIVSALILASVLGGFTRRGGEVITPQATSTEPTALLVPRRLDGMLVTREEADVAPMAVMIENHPDARPLSGLSKARVVIEAPVEGGIPRFVAFFDATTTIGEIGPVRSARPYFVDWVDGWNASYFHVGGSQEALQKITELGSFVDVNEFAYGGTVFWRDRRRAAPHNVYTSTELMTAILARKGVATSTMPIAWHFKDAVTSTERGIVNRINVPYGGSYNVTWRFVTSTGEYVRSQNGNGPQVDRDGSVVAAENVIVMKTDARVLDDVGRLRLRTVGSGEALAYRDGEKFIIRWSRAAGESIRFAGTGGNEFLLTRGRTWIEVVTDDRIFAGLE